MVFPRSAKFIKEEVDPRCCTFQLGLLRLARLVPRSPLERGPVWTGQTPQGMEQKQGQLLILPACREQFLEQNLQATARLYAKAVRDFKAWNRRNHVTLDLQALGKAFERYFNFFFFDGGGP